MPPFSDYIIFGDESGDHGLVSINPENPIFTLALCIFKKSDYITCVKQVIAKLKIDFWGHDLVIFHSREIRRSADEFSFLFDEERRQVFLHALNETIKDAPFKIIATAINKHLLKSKEQNPSNPYDLALEFSLEQAAQFLREENQCNKVTHVIVESRGKNEDRDLMLSFQKIEWAKAFFDLRFAKKETNSTGLQLADLVAYPICKYAKNPQKSNKLFDFIKLKLIGYPEFNEIGLRVHPEENERPRLSSRPIADRELTIH